MMGSGKSSAVALAAQHPGVSFVDIDEEIAAAQGTSIAKLPADSGERAFHEMETAAIGRVAGTRAIVSTGGGAVLDPSNRYRMRTTGTVVWLRARPEMLAARLAEASEGRPLLDEHPDQAPGSPSCSRRGRRPTTMRQTTRSTRPSCRWKRWR